MEDVPPADPKKNRSIYDATAGEIFWKNFLAGAGRSLGGIIFYLLFILIIGSFFLRYLAPIVSPLMDQLNSISGSLNRIPKF
ncbi:hypothetical protein A3J20_02745 [Candidatus Gottesmanbacteria bacterium RIFCSPLOWO2_02_FULL_42_29]|nr:MAG: hypothetical protein UV46_C0055G0008 [Candidatus Gottesmanbacteria bacterium GW2011_GWC2_42_8]OGG12119.1 MAG: hypothetical protein A2781_03575 [Candidatus Gottesmanbacteria bacterium RIFCSPHIGHO2_01_FULL_42_27]OGG22040.1 MAG: hypothetical protein A3E72_00920 [Candidatus Gottesmanbacteria bacterium RIFCSPHIGHO2_12_FULL_43_26]OGG35643.1 MAG: hypothetical protein A3G68_05570 [Candidatus Gottesmanbacteria bacterium RIFCSPLOWO2_12_FULL_42_10]OGG36834.1 MAG: hypothetical protein A3J20_02745 [